jgi:hypothetical protein
MKRLWESWRREYADSASGGLGKRTPNEIARQSAAFCDLTGLRHRKCEQDPPQVPYIRSVGLDLETNLGAESNLPVVMRSIRKDNFVTHIGA